MRQWTLWFFLFANESKQCLLWKHNKVCVHDSVKEKRSQGISLELTPLLLLNGTKRISYKPNKTRAALHISFTSTLGLSRRQREELLPVFPPKWKERSTIITTFSTKSWALCTGTGNNDHVLFCGDSFTLPLRLDAATPGGTCSEMSTEEASRSLWSTSGFLTRAHKVSIHCLAVAKTMLSFR